MISSSKSDLAPYIVILVACSCILLAAIILSPATSGNGHSITFGRMALPETCIFKNLVGLPCPGCGITRSITSAVRGDISGSLMHHRLGLLTVIYILGQFLLNLGIVFISGLRKRLQRVGGYLNKGIIALGILFFVNWIFTLIILLW